MKTRLAVTGTVVMLQAMFLGRGPADEIPRPFIEVDKDALGFHAGKDLVGLYHIDHQAAKPYLWPLLGPGGTALTRAWPMLKAQPGESTDHPHQKSAWFCHGDVIPEGLEPKCGAKEVQGVDFWSETPGHGSIVCTRIDPPRLGKFDSHITTQNEWRAADGTKVLDETRTIALYDLGEVRLFVFDIDLFASVTGITFGDTKEGSFGVRVNDRIREKGGKGKIENAEGKVGEKACWGEVSAWCDYSGPLDGKTVGLAILDDPANPYPACWHSRDYGLMAANPFGRVKSKFPAMKGRTDLVKLPKGQHLKLRYGLLLHPGDAREGKVGDYFQDFVKLRQRGLVRADPPAPAQPTVELLWPEGAPAALGHEDKDKPTLTVFSPPAGQANGTAVVICPGGGYGFLAIDHEGKQIAAWLNRFGVTAFMLQYRIAPRYHHPAPLQDAQRALRTVRARAKEWGIAPHRIGIWGFSAGGHLASTAGTHFDDGKPDSPDPVERVTCRPDFLILCYPVISMEPPYAHGGSRQNLLGKDADPQLVENLSNERQVTSRTPPTFLFHTDEDNGVVPENSVLFYLALRKAKVPAELHIYGKGPHGVGLAPKDPVLSSWPDRLAAWMRGRGLLPPAAPKTGKKDAALRHPHKLDN